MKKILLLGAIAILAVACGNKAKTENENAKTGQNAEYTQYLDSLKADNNLKITMGKVPVTIVGKELKVGDKIKEVPLVVNSKLDEKNIFEDKNIKVIYTAPSLDTKVCSLQTKQLNEAAKKYPNVKFYSVTVDTPFAQERFCTANEINGLKAVSDFKYHQFGIQNGFFVKEKGLLTRALTILDENNTVKYIEYVPEEGKEANIDKALKFLENNLIKK
ncbi:thiol peroxidase [uncultured Leptotrichia sp.]|jgi:redoxin domain protein|uniref:thiol peroxidase n=1 Tax=uncultured Leptotrichia sp. TaxID=159271 RepID=UPI001A443765|nr:thiol peroxidase [uncultured Leptotrichia sp.]VTX56046.1 putative thiol peroxidase [uncultured Leptotrichia sp.]